MDSVADSPTPDAAPVRHRDVRRTPVDFYTRQERNRRRTLLLIVVFLLFFLMLGFSLDAVWADRAALAQAVVPANEHLECPRCRARMHRFRDPALPQDGRIERCPNCDGMWLNRGELRHVKAHDVTGIVTSNTVSDAELDRLAEQARRAPTVRALADALDGSADSVDEADVRSDVTASVAWLIGGAALRLLLHI